MAVKIEPRYHLVDFLRALTTPHPTAETERILAKASVPAGNTGDSDYSPLAQFAGVRELITLITEEILVARIAGSVRLPFREAHPFQLDPSANAAWVPEGGAIPVTGFKATPITLPSHKIASLAVLTREILRGGQPGTENRVLRILASAVAARANATLLSDDPAIPGASPAGLGGLATGVPEGGTTMESLENMISDADDAGVNLALASWLMSPGRAAGIAAALGLETFGARGGSLLGLPALTDRHAGARIFLVAGDRLGYALGGIEVEVSRHSAIELDTEPAHDATTPTPAQLVSMFQSNALAFLTTVDASWEIVGDGVFMLGSES